MDFAQNIMLLDNRINYDESIRLKVSTKDGLSFMGAPIVPKIKENKEKRELPFALRFDEDFKRPKNELNELFDGQFLNAQDEGFVNRRFARNKKCISVMRDKIKACVGEEWCSEKVNLFVEKQLERKEHNIYQRRKRYERKVGLAPFNYFVTITNDPAKGYSDEIFKVKLKKYFNNQANRHGWKYAGKFEYGTESTERLHYHAQVYIPCDELCGELERVYRYNRVKRKSVLTNQHVYLAKRFGQNDFQPMTKMAKLYSSTTEYISKYIDKDNENLVYSRGLPSELEFSVCDSYLQSVIDIQGPKYILFSDIMDVVESIQDKRSEEALKRRKRSKSHSEKLEKIYSKLRSIQNVA